MSVSAASTSLSEGMASPSQLKYMVCVSTLLLDVWKALGVMLVEYGTVFVGFSFTYYLQGLLLLLQMVYMAYRYAEYKEYCLSLRIFGKRELHGTQVPIVVLYGRSCVELIY